MESFFTSYAAIITENIHWSVGPRRPSDQSDAFVAGFLYMFVSIYLSIYLYFYVSS